MSWEEEIVELRRREALSREMGGPDKVARQHEFGKLTIRERIAAMADADSFHEIGALAGAGSYDADGQLQAFTPFNLLLGTAEIDGRPVVLSGDDFTVRGGPRGTGVRCRSKWASKSPTRRSSPRPTTTTPTSRRSGSG